MPGRFDSVRHPAWAPSALVRAVVRPVVHGKAKRDGRAVEGIKRIVEAEAMSGRKFRASVQKLIEQVAQNRRVTPVHGVG